MDGLKLDYLGPVARITLARPEAGNAMSMGLIQGLAKAAILCDDNPDVRSVLIRGEGKLFCGGGDLAAMAKAGPEVQSFLKELAGTLHVAVSRFARMDKPLVTAINGPAAGAGLSLAVLGDIVLAARSASFTMAYTGVGLSPDGGATWLLPRLIGLRRAQEMVLTNRRVPAEEAVQIGLATRLVEDDALAAEALAVANTLANSATRALGAARNLLLASFTNSLETQMELEARSIAALSMSAHGKEGIAAFLAKRKPDYTKP